MDYVRRPKMNKRYKASIKFCTYEGYKAELTHAYNVVFKNDERTKNKNQTCLVSYWLATMVYVMWKCFEIES